MHDTEVNEKFNHKDKHTKYHWYKQNLCISSRRNANYLKCVIMSVERVHQNKWHIWAISVIQILPGKDYNKLWVSGLDIDLNDDAKWWRQRQSGEQLLDLDWDPISHCILCPTMWKKSNTPQSAWQSDPGMSIHFEPQWLTCMQNWLSVKSQTKSIITEEYSNLLNASNGQVLYPA
jgi:hypothetical protein